MSVILTVHDNNSGGAVVHNPGFSQTLGGFFEDTLDVSPRELETVTGVQFVYTGLPQYFGQTSQYPSHGCGRGLTVSPCFPPGLGAPDVSVPSPAPLGLFGIGLILMAAVLHRRIKYERKSV